MKEEWVALQLEFRFPHVGDLDSRNVHLEVRQALEPWHVLGEEAGPGGTVRSVDSSVERVEVKVRGLVDTRHVLAVGGIAVPSHPTAPPAEYAHRGRHRASPPPS